MMSLTRGEHAGLPYVNLATAIVKQAADDLLLAEAGLVAKGEANVISKQQLHKFFKSDWYKHLTSVSGDYIVHKIEKRAHQLVFEYDVISVGDDKWIVTYTDSRRGQNAEPDKEVYRSIASAKARAAHMMGMSYPIYCKLKAKKDRWNNVV